MNDYSEVFQLIENGEWDLTDFSVWLDDYHNKSYNEGYNQCKELVEKCLDVL